MTATIELSRLRAVNHFGKKQLIKQKGGSVQQSFSNKCKRNKTAKNNGRMIQRDP